MLTNNDYEVLYRKNPSAYALKISEEFAECIVELTHFMDGKTTRQNVLDEIADVEIQLEKFKMLVAEFNHHKYVVAFNEIQEIKSGKIWNLKNLVSGMRE